MVHRIDGFYNSQSSSFRARHCTLLGLHLSVPALRRTAGPAPTLLAARPPRRPSPGDAHQFTKSEREVPSSQLANRADRARGTSHGFHPKRWKREEELPRSRRAAQTGRRRPAAIVCSHRRRQHGAAGALGGHPTSFLSPSKPGCLGTRAAAKPPPPPPLPRCETARGIIALKIFT